MKSEPVEIQIRTLRVILKRLYNSETIKEWDTKDIARLEVLSRQRLRITNRTTGEVIEIG
jgi:hypothetical protein